MQNHFCIREYRNNIYYLPRQKLNINVQSDSILTIAGKWMGVSFNNSQHDYAFLKRAQDKRVSDIALGTLDTKDPDADTHLLLVEAK
ncbi:hypothetical protein [Escherichia sp. E2748]|uniref:hypothetical protein n=1 Tax=Escherichia sp. E2748 TaxID=2044460 RepID=UPI001080DEA9|nr:hypothetical protein [Escherichia sp. E2748]TLI85794.1 hypothetical protein FEK42_13685 [Escherichia sp. E2748]